MKLKPSSNNKAIKLLLQLIFLAFAFVFSTQSISTENIIELPVLGDSSAGLMTPAEEYALGQAWLRSYRNSVNQLDDPLVFEYFENLLYELASHSKLEKKDLTLVIVDNPTINAFAVPGGVVGIHTGLILNAQNQAQIASVVSHELAHLSQRHFARSVEAARESSITNILALLAGIAIAAASNNSDAIPAVITTSQALALDSQLRYSRLHEREADRIGMQTMVEAGYDATAAADMFRVMQNTYRLYGQGLPEFLLTHPITESRISDAENRARLTNKDGITNTLDYAIIRSKIEFEDLINKRVTTNDIAKHFRQKFETAQKLKTSQTDIITKESARYAYAMALNANKQWKKARKTLNPLLQQVPGRIAYSLLDIEIDITAKNNQLAEKRLRDLYSITPNNYAISMQLAETLIDNQKPEAASKVLQALASTRPYQEDIWYLLAESQGLAKNILGLHQSRAEFFILRGNLTQARNHLGFALNIAGNQFKTSAKIKERIKQVNGIEKMLERFK